MRRLRPTAAQFSSSKTLLEGSSVRFGRNSQYYGRKRHQRALIAVATTIFLFLLSVIVQPTSLDTAQSSALEQNRHFSKGSFRILCSFVTENPYWFQVGSYQIRCRDLADYIKKYYPNEPIVVDTVPLSQATGIYNATILIKSVFSVNPIKRWWELRNTKLSRNAYGQIWVDVVDKYQLPEWQVPTDFGVIVQNNAQAAVFPHRKVRVLTHWYNSYPADVDRPIQFPVIQEEPELRIAAIWNPVPPDTCPDANEIPTEVMMECIVENYDIASWYNKYLPDTPTLQKALQNPENGPGYIYQHLFRQYHVLLLLVKSGPKQRFGNVQRIVSQMRSGVPVWIERKGAAFEEFIDHYQYPCVFTMNEWNNNNELWENMWSTEKRKECQTMAERITADYSPRSIVKQYLDVLGYPLAG